MAFQNLRQSFQRPKLEQNDLGFGTKITSATRFINKDGSFNVTRRTGTVYNMYQILTEISWMKYFVLVFIFYFIVNVIFAWLFVAAGVEQTLNGMESGNSISSFWHAFFFSIQTFTTVGYGAMSPKGWLGNSIAAADALTGSLTLALSTGLLFARFAKPRADILFSHKAVIVPYLDITGFMFRMANMRTNRIFDLEVQVTMSWIEEENGEKKRRFIQLPLERSKVTLFPLNWTIVHPIEESSPMYGKNLVELQRMNLEVMVIAKGFDETFGQYIHTTASYLSDELVMNEKFSPMYRTDPRHGTILDLRMIDETEVVG